MEATSCQVCGSTDFLKQSGYYICSNCDTQSQDVQEQDFEYNADNPIIDDKRDEEVLKRNEEDDERKLTSWECYNLILKGLVEELIGLGAGNDLRSIAFQLWASYLKNDGIAFFSETEEQLPKLPSTFKNKDVEILYGIKNFKRMFYEKNFDSVMRRRGKKTDKMKETKNGEESDDVSNSGSSDCSTRSLRSKQRKLASSILEDDDSMCVSDGETSVAETDQPLNRLSQTNLQFGKRVKIAFDSCSQKRMEELKNKLSKVKKVHGNNIPSNVKTWFANRIYSTRNSRNRDKLPLNMNTMVLILHTSLLLMEDDIQLADLLRWIYEGKLSFYQPRKLIPVKNNDLKYNDVYLCSRSNHLFDMKYFTHALNIDDIPTPDILKLVKRYCYELCLPNSLTDYVQRVIALFPPQMDYTYYEYRIFPDYECRAMAFILFSFKLLFSLDDATEFQQAKFADAINKHRKEVEIEGVPELFSWLSWTKFIECRKAILAKYNVPMNLLVNVEYTVDDNVTLEYWKKVQPDVSHTPEEIRINPVLKSQLDNTVHQLRNKCVKETIETVGINFSTLTPWRTYTDYLLSEHPQIITERSRKILSANTDACSINYLVDPEWAVALGKSCDIEVQPVYNVANDETKQYEEPEIKSNLPMISNIRSVPAYMPVLVNISSESMHKETETRGELYESKANKIEEDSNGRRMLNTLQLHYPSSTYWFFHPAHAKFNHESFSQLAEENFSHSFLWLLKECAGILRADYRDLFKELMVIEVALSSLYSDASYATLAPIRMYAPEW